MTTLLVCLTSSVKDCVSVGEEGEGYRLDFVDGTSRAPTASEIDTAQQAVQRAIIQAQIDAMEREQMLPRISREFMIFDCEARFTPEQLATAIGYTKLKAFDVEIKALREQL